MCSTAVSVIWSHHTALVLCSYSVIWRMCNARYTHDDYAQALFILELMMLRQDILYVAGITKIIN